MGINANKDTIKELYKFFFLQKKYNKIGDAMKNRIDKILIAAIIILSIFGIIMIYSASSIWAEYKFNDSFHYLKYQSVFS